MRRVISRALLLAFLSGAGSLTAQQAPASSSGTLEAEVAQLKARLNDFGQLSRYAAEDAALPAPAPGVQRVVFFGDSLTDNWGRHPDTGAFFPGKPYINRGISGQTTPQMLIRFRQDVLDLHPAAVVLLAGENDIAGNTGPESMQFLEGNIRSMVTLAQAAHVRVVLASALPADHFPWRPGSHPAAQIRELNRWLESFAREQGLVWLNYYPALANADGGMIPELALDGAVHPNAAGYARMAPLAQAAITRALEKPVR